MPLDLSWFPALGSNNFSTKMDGRHTAVNLEVLQEEQRSIDDIINSLLNYSAASVNKCGEGKEKRSVGSAFTNSSTSSPSQAKKGRGRPPKQNLPPLSPVPSVSSPGPSVSSDKQSFGSIVECLKRLSDQNRNLLNFVEVLSEEVKNNVNAVTVSGADRPSGPENGEVQSSASVSVVEERLEKLEQNMNSNILICRGDRVESLIAESTRDSTQPNLERLKGDVCKAVCGDEVTNVDICSMRMNVFGSDKKKIKIDCRNPESKVFLLKQAKKKHPEGIYISEFLTKSKLSIFYNLRQLKKQHPGKIQSVFTRGGNLFYRLRGSDREVRVNSSSDLQGIIAGAEVERENSN